MITLADPVESKSSHRSLGKNIERPDGGDYTRHGDGSEMDLSSSLVPECEQREQRIRVEGEVSMVGRLPSICKHLGSPSALIKINE